MQESSTIPALKYFTTKVEDLEIKALMEKALQTSKENLAELAGVFQKEDYHVPVGFSDEDVNVNAPRLYSDIYMLVYLRNMGKAGIASNGLAFSFLAREDIRKLYLGYLNASTQIQDDAKSVMLSKGVFVRPPYLSSPHEVSYVEKESFLNGWMGERRTLTAEEISHIFMNYANNVYGKALLMGFAQTAQEKKVRDYFLRGIELSRKIVDSLKLLFEESSLPSPTTWDTEVTDATTQVFSDKLMMFQVLSLNSLSLGNRLN